MAGQTRRNRPSPISGSGCGSWAKIIFFLLIGLLVLYVFVLIKYVIIGADTKSNQHHVPSNSNSHVADDKLISSKFKNSSAPLSSQHQELLSRASLPGQLRRRDSAATKTQNASSQSDKLNPNDSVTAIIQCSTTQGNITIDVRGHWAPQGSQRFLDLVEKKLFSNLPFFRVCPRYITQFGVKYGYQERFGNIPDDPSLWGIRDMNFGYVFFAGHGTNSRSSQMVIALCDTPACRATTLGKTPWEVPVGTIRRDGFATLVAIERSGYPYPKLEMTGQAPKAAGPNQQRIQTDPHYLSENYAHMEYFDECHVEAREVSLDRPLFLDHSSAAILTDMSRYPNTSLDDGHVFVEMMVVVNGNNNGGAPISLAQRIVIEVIPEWAPIGAQRFLELVNSLYFDGASFFRVIKGFMAQFGIAASPELSAYWRKQSILDDPVKGSNTRGAISFAMAGKNTRTSQIFINFGDNSRLDNEGFAPFGRVVEGMEEVIDHLYNKYGEGGKGDGTDGRGPSQGKINNQGKKYLEKYFPKLSFIRFATVIGNQKHLQHHTFGKVPNV